MYFFPHPAWCRTSSLKVTIEAEKDSEILVLPPHIYKSLMEESAPMANFSNQIMASHFSEVMWLIEQIMWKSFDKRLAAFLVEETLLENTDILKITHEKIANHLGTAREVVTRMLRYFQSENLVRLSRGTIEITDKKRTGRTFRMNMFNTKQGLLFRPVHPEGIPCFYFLFNFTEPCPGSLLLASHP